MARKTPIVDKTAATEMGFSLILYANAALQRPPHGMQAILRMLGENGTLDERDSHVASFAERQRLVGKATFEMVKKYAHPIVTRAEVSR